MLSIVPAYDGAALCQEPRRCLLNDPTTGGRKRPQKMAEIARRLGIELQTIDIHGPDDLEPASLQAAALAGVGQGNTTEEAG
jgi:hypothetical protein